MPKTTLEAERCASCRFFLGDTPESGTCRRYPPSVIPQSWVGSPGAVQQGSKLDPKAQPPLPVMVYQVNNLAAYFPNMHPHQGWCGEHSPKDAIN